MQLAVEGRERAALVLGSWEQLVWRSVGRGEVSCVCVFFMCVGRRDWGLIYIHIIDYFLLVFFFGKLFNHGKNSHNDPSSPLFSCPSSTFLSFFFILSTHQPINQTNLYLPAQSIPQTRLRYQKEMIGLSSGEDEWADEGEKKWADEGEKNGGEKGKGKESGKEKEREKGLDEKGKRARKSEGGSGRKR